MTPRSLPDRPSLEHLKKEAKALLRDAQGGDAAARGRFAALPAFSELSPSALASVELALHDAQSVVAREYGFPSWNAMRDDIEARSLSFEAAVEAFVRAATGHSARKAERLLALHPGIASATLETALVLGDAAGVQSRIRQQPSLVNARGGPQQWEPLLYACHTCLHETSPARLDGLMAIARFLCGAGANPNAEYHWNWHPELPRTALWAALCAVHHLPLAEVLLEAGANPTDGVSVHIAGSGNVAALDLLARYGVNVNGIPGGVPPLVYMMGFATTPVGPDWLLDHGADPNLAWGAAGEAPLHVAARRWDVGMVERLVAHGADVERRRADGATPHRVAELSGQHDIAVWLLEHGAVDELSPLDRFVAACARADRAAAEAALAAQPSLRTSLGHDQHLMLAGPAERGDVPVLETMLACGFDPRVKDADGVTPLHRAAMSGYPDAARVLLAAGADVDAKDGMFSATPLVWAVEGRRNAKRADADHVGVARVLIAAGSALTWDAPEGAPSPEGTVEGLLDLRRAASA